MMLSYGKSKNKHFFFAGVFRYMSQFLSYLEKNTFIWCTAFICVLAQVRPRSLHFQRWEGDQGPSLWAPPAIQVGHRCTAYQGIKLAKKKLKKKLVENFLSPIFSIFFLNNSKTKLKIEKRQRRNPHYFSILHRKTS